MKNKAPSTGSKKNDKFQAMAIQLYKDYMSLGDLERVAKIHRISKGLASRILQTGNSEGLFKYPPEKPPFVQQITCEKLIHDYIEYGSITRMAQHHDIAKGKILSAMENYNLSLKELRLEIAKDKLLKDYENMVKKIGHPPTYSEMKQHVIWKNIYYRIAYRYGSLENFRKSHEYHVIQEKLHLETAGDEKFMGYYKYLCRNAPIDS